MSVSSPLQQSLPLIKDFLEKHPDGVIEITGPTASGKTGLSIEVGKELGRGEIISVDSRQVYRECDVSSDKISKEAMQGVPHHGLNLVNFEEPFNVYQFQQYAIETIQDIQARNAIPILCGGTMLWLDAISENYIFSEEKNFHAPYPKSTQKAPPRWPFLKIGLQWDREMLYKRIDQRAEQHFKNGLIEETQKLMQTYDLTGYHPHKKKPAENVLTSFGYHEIAAYLEGRMTYDEALRQNQQRNRNYAKRQLTWWRGREDIHWIDMNQTD